MANPNLKENKFKRALALPFRNIIKGINPTLYVKLQYKYITGHELDLDNPVRYTEKLQYLRLFSYPKDKNVSRCASRDGVREYLKENNLEKILVPCIGVFDSFDQIDFAKLPNQFVIKCTHACGYNLIVKGKNKLDIKKTRKLFNKWLGTDYGKKTCERHYSNIKPRIIIEEYLGESPLEYKIHVFNGKAKYLYVVSNRGKDIRYTNLYIDWKPFNGAQFNGWKTSETKINKPSNFDEMVKIAEKLAKPFPFVRVDLYNINGKIYFSEMTFTPAKGTLKFDDDQADYEIGEWLKIK